MSKQQCTALHCTALHCIALHCTALHCTVCSTDSNTSTTSHRGRDCDDDDDDVVVGRRLWATMVASVINDDWLPAGGCPTTAKLASPLAPEPTRRSNGDAEPGRLPMLPGSMLPAVVGRPLLLRLYRNEPVLVSCASAPPPPPPPPPLLAPGAGWLGGDGSM